MPTSPAPLEFGPVHDSAHPLAVLVHGFPDTPSTWRYLGPRLADHGYRVVAPWLPGYGTPESGSIDVGTYVRCILDTREVYGGDERSVLIGHDWGASAGYGAVSYAPRAFCRFVSLAIPPTAVLGAGIFRYAQLRRSFYVWFIQQVGIAEMALLEPGFWESLWGDWSPGYDPGEDIAVMRRYVTADTIAGVISPYRASLNADFADPAAKAEATSAMNLPPVPTLYLHGRDDGAVGAELLVDVEDHLPAPGSAFDLLDGLGHFLHLEAPDAVWERVRPFLDGVAEPSG